tara:strand:+ start:89 stop:1198 length:1110 start_codon:yes stop_codon:yes gene_type:complete
MKVSVVGGGNAGVFTALYYGWYGKALDIEVDLIYNPEILPEPVGQATLLDPPKILWNALGFNWYNNNINATMKSGILYEGFGEVNDKVFHDFPSNRMAMHYCPWEMQASVLKSGHFNVVHGDVDPKDVDSDLVFDCRGKPDDYSDYEELLNPTNACILAKPNWDTSKQYWSRHVATPDGWTFVIPTHSKSPSHDYCVGYCYNSNITSKKDAEKNMLEMFDVEITKNVNYKNYVAKNPLIDDRIVLNGNRLFFLEPMESSSVESYIEVSRYVSNNGFKGFSDKVGTYIRHLQYFILWHYQFGSKYDTPFWNYAKSLRFIDPTFDALLRKSRRMGWDEIKLDGETNDTPTYAQWTPYAFKLWYEGMTKKEK